MNIFVTGASGFIGSKLVEALSSDPQVNHVFGLYRSKEQIPFIPKLNPVIGDLNALSEMKLDARIDIMVHLAGYFQTDSKALCEEINYEGTQKVLLLCKNNNIPKILFFSTINVDLKHKGNYATSKLKAEEAVKGSGLSYMIVRPSLVYEGRTGSIGKIISYAEKLPFVPIFGSGKAKEQPIHRSELIALTMMMVKSFKPGNTLYAAGLEAMPFKEMVKAIGRSINKKVRLLRIPSTPVYWSIKFIEKTGLRPFVSSEQVAHMSETLEADMEQTLKLYPVKLTSFEEWLKADLN